MLYTHAQDSCTIILLKQYLGRINWTSIREQVPTRKTVGKRPSSHFVCAFGTVPRSKRK